MNLSLIIPAYNEEHRIRRTLEQIEAFAREAALQCEVLVVLDGSTDGTRHIVQEFLERETPVAFRLLEQPRNMGKGAAVRRGVAEAMGDIIGFTDADLPYGTAGIPGVLDIFRRESAVQIVIGARDCVQSPDERSTPFLRRISGRAYSFLVQTVMSTGIPDTQCGFKFFRKEVAKPVFSRGTVDGFGFDVEIIHIAQVNGFPIERFPVAVQQFEGSSVRLIRDSLKMFCELFQIRARDLRHYYTLQMERDGVSGDYQYRALTQGYRVQQAWHRNRLNILEKALNSCACDRVLDAGCGSGLALNALAGRSRTLVGLDTSTECLRFAMRTSARERTGFARGTACRLPFRAGIFDLILFQEVIEHLPEKDARQSLSEFHRVLKPGGRLYITTPNYASLWGVVEYFLDVLRLTPRMGGDQHVSRFTRSSLRRLLEESGFRVAQMGAFNFVSPWTALFSRALADKLFAVEVKRPDLPGLLLYCVAAKPDADPCVKRNGNDGTCVG
jgi:dolichyl-phosphate beta-glucosyltransferase